MKVGECISTRKVRHYSGKNWFEYKAEKDKQMVFLYLGQELKNGKSPLNPDEALKRLGWIINKPPLIINMQSRPNDKDARSCKFLKENDNG